MNDLRVLLDEEFGYRRFFWHPKMELSDFIAWWEGLDSVEGFTTCPESYGVQLPGERIEVETEDQWALWYQCNDDISTVFVHFFNDGDSYLRANDEIHRHKGYNPHYYDAKPTDTLMSVDGEGNVICHHLREEEATCEKCRERKCERT